jgi:hypothetical protein
MSKETADQKIDNLETLAICAKEIGQNYNFSVDEDGFYYIWNNNSRLKMFTDYKSALKFISEK